MALTFVASVFLSYCQGGFLGRFTLTWWWILALWLDRLSSDLGRDLAIVMMFFSGWRCILHNILQVIRLWFIINFVGYTELGNDCNIWIIIVRLLTMFINKGDFLSVECTVLWILLSSVVVVGLGSQGCQSRDKTSFQGNMKFEMFIRSWYNNIGYQ